MCDIEPIFGVCGSVHDTSDPQEVLGNMALPSLDESCLDLVDYEKRGALEGCVLFCAQTSTTNVTHQARLLRRLHYNFLRQFGQEISFDITVSLSGRVMQISKAKGSAPVVYTIGGIQRPVIMSTHTESGKLIVKGAYLDGTVFHAAQDRQTAVEHLVVLESSKQTAEQKPGSCLSGQFLACTCIISVCCTHV